MTGPTLRIMPASGAVTGVVLVLPGGRATSDGPGSRRHLSYLRLRPFARVISAATRGRGVAVWQVAYRVRGWNGARRDPVADARWALARIAGEHPGVPVVIVGHSMGGRTGLYVAGDPGVAAVCALAPWIEPGDPVAQVADRLIVIAHGDQDRITDPRASRRYAGDAEAAGATVVYFDVLGDRHGMLRRAADWHALARDTVRYAFGLGDTGQLGRLLGSPAPRSAELSRRR